MSPGVPLCLHQKTACTLEYLKPAVLRFWRRRDTIRSLTVVITAVIRVIPRKSYLFRTRAAFWQPFLLSEAGEEAC